MSEDEYAQLQTRKKRAEAAAKAQDTRKRNELDRFILGKELRAKRPASTRGMISNKHKKLIKKLKLVDPANIKKRG